MNIYTHYSDSHKELYEDFFKPSLRDIYNKDEVSIRAAYHKQTTNEGKFMEAGWLDSMRYKLQVILQAIEENSNDYFIFADTDIVFYNDFIDDLKESLGDKDIACQEDCNSLCAGFFIARGNDKNKKLFTEIYNNFTEMVNDQVALNRLKDMVDYKFLDKEKYYTIGNFYNNSDGTHVWDGVTSIMPPKNIKLHHANYVVGVEDKIKLIKLIRSHYLAMVE